jgi:hypothetical protein
MPRVVQRSAPQAVYPVNDMNVPIILVEWILLRMIEKSPDTHQGAC